MDELLLSARTPDLGRVDLDALFALPSAALALVDLEEKRVLRVTDALAALLGGVPADSAGRPWREVVADSGDPDARALPPALPSGPVALRLVRQNGTSLAVEWQTVALVNAGGRSCVVGSVRAQVETSLREQQAWFHSVANGLPVVIWVTRPDGTLEFLSERWYELTGQDAAQAGGTGWTQAIHPEDRDRVRASFMRSVEDEGVFDSEYRLRGANGEYVWVLDRGGPSYGPDGEVRARVGVILDVEDRRRTAMALAEARALLDAIFESAPVGIGFFDRDLRFQRLNEKLAEYNGLPADAHLGKTPAELLPGIEDVERLMDRWREMIGNGSPLINVEVTGETFAVPGRQRSWDETFFPVRLGGQTVGLAAVVQETTERRIAERALSASEARFRHLTEAAPVMAWTAEPEGRLTYASPSVLAFAGLASLSEPPALTIADVVATDDRERLNDAWQASLRDASHFEFEGRATDRQNGRSRWLLTRAVPVTDARGRVVEWVGASVDLTETRRATEALEEADRNKDEFLAMLAHELRNPLGPIRNAAQLHRGPDPDGGVHQTARGMIERQVAHIVRLVDDLLDISRLSRGRIALRTSRVDLVAIVRETITDYRPLLQGAGLAFSEDLPSTPLWMQADATRLAQIVGNLLHNTRKFTPAGGSVHASVSVAPGGTSATVRVRDSGIGIEPELLPFVFEPFRQGRQGLDRGRGGLGLGLSLVRGLAALHDGTVAVRSDGAHRGAEFTVTLPLTPEVAATPPARSAVAADAPSRVLVIEDNPDSAESLRLLLMLGGHEVRVAETGASGLGIARTFAPETILCDVGLPGGLSGYDVARAIRADEHLRHCRLIALTGYGRDEDLAESIRAGFDVHLTKPVDYERLAALLAGSPPGTLAEP